MAIKDDIDSIGQRIANAIEGGTPLENIQANIDVLSRGLANRLPEDVGFIVVLFNRRESELNAVAGDMSTPDMIDKLYRVRQQLKDGAIKTEWSKDEEIRESRIVRVN